MTAKRWKALRWIRSNPKCVFCSIRVKPTIVFYIEETAIKGWKCPKCGFTLMHPNGITKAMEYLKVMRLSV